MSSYSVLNTGSGKKHTHTVRRLQWSYRFYSFSKLWAFPVFYSITSSLSHSAGKELFEVSQTKTTKSNNNIITTLDVNCATDSTFCDCVRESCRLPGMLSSASVGKSREYRLKDVFPVFWLFFIRLVSILTSVEGSSINLIAKLNNRIPGLVIKMYSNFVLWLVN